MNEVLILDLRTPEETAEGFLDEAICVDFLAENFASEIVQYPKDADYVLYCRSGGRVSKAIPLMRELGFTGELTNLGGLEDAAAVTGRPIVDGDHFVEGMGS